MIAIFRSSSSGSNTSNNNTWTWTIPGYNGSIINAPASPMVTQTLYRRNTHDENGNPRSLNRAQEQAWSDSWPIGAMTSDIVWKTAEEIAQAANAYIQLIRMTENTYYSPEAVSEILSALAVYGMVESRTV